MAAGGAIEDLDPILTQFITSEQGSSLGSGASGAAVQCLNIMMGIDETTSLI